MQNYSYDDFRSMMDNVFAKYKDKTAITYITDSDSKIRYSFDDIYRFTNEIQEKLQERKISVGERVAVVAPHSPYAVIAEFSLAYLNITAVMIDASLPTEEINRLLAWSDISALFTTNDIFAKIDHEILNEIAVFELFDTKNSIFCKKIKDNSAPKTLAAPINKNIIAIIYSSGTTGTVKGVEITYNSIVYAYRYMCAYTNISDKISFLNILPVNHIAGYSTAFSCFFVGAEMGFVYEVNSYYLSKGFSLYEPTNFIMIPKVYDVIKNKISAEIDKNSLPLRKFVWGLIGFSGFIRKHTGVKLKFLTNFIVKRAMGKNMVICGCGTAPCSEETAKFYLDLGIDFVNVYGSTETGFPITAANCKTHKYPCSGAGSIHQFPEIDIRISDRAAEGTGEICVRSPLMMNGYFRDPQATALSFDDDGFFKTGDLGCINDDGTLYITGRIKESILLGSGKKVSPYDVDAFYQKVCGNIEIASCGIPDKSGMFDKICVFIETNGKTDEETVAAKNNILKLSRSEDNIYKVSDIRYIDNIPRTSTGKIKRYLLKEKLSENETYEAAKSGAAENTEEYIIKLLSEKFNISAPITGESILTSDLGIDSLEMFELFAEIESHYDADIFRDASTPATVGDIVYAIENGGVSKQKKDYNIEDFPLEKTGSDEKFIRRFYSFTKKTYDFNVLGIEKLSSDDRFILCPNHESYFDSLWIFSALYNSGKNINSFFSLAAEHLISKPLMKKAVRAVGGIPVDRSGNTAPAIKRALNCLMLEKCILLVHPEGTRTRTGKLGEFKQGAAMLSLDSGVKIVPVCIKGAYKIFPPDKKLPKLRKYPLQIEFGIPIEPEGKTAEQITNEMREQISNMKRS